MDLVWKPVGFVKQSGYQMMAKRCYSKPERPFAYCHYENIQILTTKSGLVRSLREYYEKSPMFQEARYCYEHTMAQSYFLQGGDFFENDELHRVRRVFNKIEKKHFHGEYLSSRQMKKNMWILKPENENRGRGIELVSSYKQLLAQLCGKIKGEKFII